MKKSLVNKLIIIALFYTLSVVVLFTMQRSMIYFPDKSRPTPVKGAVIAKVITQDQLLLESWYFPATIPGKQVIVFFHGNAGNYGARIFKAQYYLNEGYGVLLAEYRGYGGNPGSISEQGLYLDGRAYIDWLINKKSVQIEDIVLYGESLGTGIAVQMATEYDVAGVSLEVPFSSLVDVASNQYPFAPVKYLLKDRFMSIDKIAKINAPLLILHGHKDKVIPFKFARKLFNKAVEPKKITEFPKGGHNDLYDFNAHTHVLGFLAGIDSHYK